MSSEINYQQLARDLDKLGVGITVSETHGTLCGMLCGQSDLNIHQWLSLTLLNDADQDSNAVTSRDLLREAISESFKMFFISTLKSLSDNNLKFYPLLPEQGTHLEQLNAIAEWSQGFLMGVSLIGIKDFSRYPDEVTEFIEAMAAISNVADYELAGDASDEEAIVEFIEFIRMGVLFFNEELNPIRVPVDIPAAIADSLKKNSLN